MSLADRIKDMRLQADISVSKLAEMAGISKGYLSQLENGEASNPTWQVLTKIAEALGTDPTYLMGAEDSSALEGVHLPGGLKQFIEECQDQGTPIPDEDIRMLSEIKYRGRQPRSSVDWAYLYETIRRTIR